MIKLIVTAALTGSLLASTIGCGATSSEEQRRALTHQQNSDNAAKAGQYGVADAEQRKAQDAHHSAVDKAMNEGKPIPAQPQYGDAPPPPATP